MVLKTVQINFSTTFKLEIKTLEAEYTVFFVLWSNSDVHPSEAESSLTVVDEVLEDLFAAGLHSVMQQRAAGRVLQQDVRRLLVELHQLHDNTDVWVSVSSNKGRGGA